MVRRIVAEKMRSCWRCGTGNFEENSVCWSCGAWLVAPPQPAPVVQLPLVSDVQQRSLQNPRNAIAVAVWERKNTDRTITPWLVVFILIFEFILLLIALVQGFTDIRLIPEWVDLAFSVVTFVFVPYMGYLTFHLVKRNNAHFAREGRLREAVLSFLCSVPKSEHASYDAENFLSWMVQRSAVPPKAEKQRSCWFWTFVMVFPDVLAIIAGTVAATLYLSDPERFLRLLEELMPMLFPTGVVLAALFYVAFVILQLYLMYFLTKEIQDHDARWAMFVDNAVVAVAKLGYSIAAMSPPRRIKPRDPVLSIVLYLLTGVYVVYWWYFLVADPNDHFTKQRAAEDSLAKLFGVERLD